MDLEPHFIKKRSSGFDDSSLYNNESDQLQSDDEDPYSFSSTSTALFGLAIVFVTLGIPLLAILNERPAAKQSTHPTSIDQNGLKSSSSFTVSWISKFSC